MAFIQTVLEIPDDVHLRVLAGEYVRDGGVVRDQLGRLVKLLDDGGSRTILKSRFSRWPPRRWHIQGRHCSVQGR